MAKLTTLKPRLTELKKQTATPQIQIQVSKSKWGTGRGHDWRLLREKILLRDRYTCQHCGLVSMQKGVMECDHIVNVAQGGTDDPNNLQILCKDCHKLKSQKEATAGAYGMTTDQL